MEQPKDKLNLKILLPIFLVVLAVIVIMVIISRYYLLQNNEKRTNDLIKTKVAALNKTLTQRADQAVYAASIVASLDFTERGFKRFRRTGSVDSGAAVLAPHVAEITSYLKRYTSDMAKIHYHTPDARSFYRSFSEQRGDDLSDFRQTVVEISRTKKPVKGLEIGRSGLVMRGIAPVKGNEGEYLGSAGVILGLDNYLNASKTSDNEAIAMFMHENRLGVATASDNISTNVSGAQLRVGAYINVDRTNADMDFASISPQAMEKGAEGVHILEKGEYVYGIYPVKDFSDDVVGTGVYRLDNSEFKQAVTTMNAVIAGTGALAVVALLIIIGTLVSRTVIKPVNNAVALTEAIAKGDLTRQVTITNSDEIGTLLRHMASMRDQLREIVDNIVDGAGNIASASSQVQHSAQQISDSAQQQASSVEEVSSSMEEMSKNIEQNSENSAETRQIAKQATVGINEGKTSFDKSVQSMKEIAEKITVINDIASQTNILALNAAVEAARAGKYGKGFSVVAAEVRKLADHSRESARQIEELSRKGVSVSQQSGQKLAEILPDIEKTSKLVEAISASSQEQDSGARQVNDAVQQLNNLSQQNASSSEELSANSETLAGQADKLREMVAFFKTT